MTSCMQFHDENCGDCRLFTTTASFLHVSFCEVFFWLCVYPGGILRYPYSGNHLECFPPSFRCEKLDWTSLGIGHQPKVDSSKKCWNLNYVWVDMMTLEDE